MRVAPQQSSGRILLWIVGSARGRKILARVEPIERRRAAILAAAHATPVGALTLAGLTRHIRLATIAVVAAVVCRGGADGADHGECKQRSEDCLTHFS